MRLVTFEIDGRRALGAETGSGVVDLSSDGSLPADMVDFIALGPDGLEKARKLAADGRPVEGARLLAPIRPRNNVMCVGKNYVEHVKESASFNSISDAPPEDPVVFTKAASSITGPYDDVTVSTDDTGSSDYEGELAIVIGTGGHKIAAADAWNYIFGYTALNDMTVRTLQQRHKQFFIGKSAVGYCPIGPCIVTADEIGDVPSIRVQTSVNGELRQSAPLSLMIFDIPTVIAAISASVRLEPGDVIATGTPAGVGIGFTPPKFLQAGDVVEVTVDRIGTLRNRMV